MTTAQYTNKRAAVAAAMTHLKAFNLDEVWVQGDDHTHWCDTCEVGLTLKDDEWVDVDHMAETHASIESEQRRDFEQVFKRTMT